MEENSQNAQMKPRDDVGLSAASTGAVNGPVISTSGMSNDPLNVKPFKPGSFKRNARLSVVITALGAALFVPLLIGCFMESSYSRSSFFISNPIMAWVILLISPFLPSIIIWIVSLVKKKEGAHGWILGPLGAIAICVVILGGCSIMISGIN